MSLSDAVNPHSPAPTTATSRTAGAYRRGWDPSKAAARFYAAYFAVLGVVLPFLGPYLKWRGFSAAAIGLITAAFSLAKLGYAPWLAGLADRGRWRWGVLTGHGVVAVGAALLLVWVGSATGVAALVLVLGTGYGAVLPVVEAATLERLAPFVYGRLRLWGSVGFVVAAAGSASAWRWLGPVVFPLAVTVPLLLTTASVVAFEPFAAGQPNEEASDPRIPAAAWAVLAVLATNQLLHGPYYAFFSIHLLDSGYGSGALVALWSLAVLAELVAFAAAGRLERRWGHRRVLTAAFLGGALRWALLALPPSALVVALAQLGHAASFALAHAAGIQLAGRLAPRGTGRRVQALYSGLVFGLGIVAGSALAGPLYARLLGRGAFATAALGGAVLCALWLPLGERLQPAPPVKR